MKFNVSSFIFCFLLVCINVYADLTEDEKTTLLELHKEARAAVNAPDMKELFWNETLADSAQVNYYIFIYCKSLYIIYFSFFLKKISL